MLYCNILKTLILSFFSFLRSRIDYKAKSENELSFHVGEKLVVVNSCAKIDTDEGYMWVAKKLGADGELVQGLIPKQR